MRFKKEVYYDIFPLNPGAHVYKVHCLIIANSVEQEFALPVWIPGSYMVREFAKNIITINAFVDNKPARLKKTDKTRFSLNTTIGAHIRLEYEVYAFDLSVRTAYLDEQRGFFNASSLCLLPSGFDEASFVLCLHKPQTKQAEHWSVATAMMAVPGKKSLDKNGFGRYQASSYDELIDHPFEFGELTRYVFEAGGVEHQIVLSGRHHCDGKRLVEDAQKICQTHNRLFGNKSPLLGKYPRYLFLTAVLPKAYGGLEHRASTALMCSPMDLPYPGMTEATPEYRNFLGLLSHEYFHLWNVKRIKPAAFQPYQLFTENYTRLLWLFEGFTSYYDELALARSSVISELEYFTMLKESIRRHDAAEGRLVQSLGDSSFDAWTKYYRQDENAVNAVVSYYVKGAMLALCLDMRLRQQNRNELSLDVFMLHLWKHYGKVQCGIEEGEPFRIIKELADSKTADWLRKMVDSCTELELDKALGAVGINSTWEEEKTPYSGLLISASGAANVRAVYRDSPASCAGIAAKDEIIAVAGLRVSASDVEAHLRRHSQGACRIDFFREGVLRHTEITLTRRKTRQLTYLPSDKLSAKIRQRRQQWLLLK